jgi:hypothetical protein
VSRFASRSVEIAGVTALLISLPRFSFTNVG